MFRHIPLKMAKYPKKRSYRKNSRPLKAARFSKVKRDALTKKMRQIAKSTMNSTVETKQYTSTVTDGTQILHNNFITITSTPFYTLNGTSDGDVIGTNQVRIGDEVTARGFSLKMMVELNERYSDVTFRLMMIKCARGDTPTRATLYRGNSGNKMIDDINKERYTVIAQKFFKIKAPNQGVGGWNGTTVQTDDVEAVVGGSGILKPHALNTASVISRATKMVSLWVPARKFAGRNGRLVYENGSPNPKFFDYHLVLYAYSNYSTNQDLWNVGRINDTVTKFYFKDA